MSVTVNLSALPVAARQRADWATYNALTPRSQSHGWKYTDPTTGVRVHKLTDASYPLAGNVVARDDYSNGGPYCTRVWTGGDGRERVTVHALTSLGGSGVGYFLDVVLGASGGVENARTTPVNQQDTASSFSKNPATPKVWFAMDGKILRKYDSSTGAEITSSAFPKDLTAYMPYGAQTWLMHSDDETWFSVCNSGLSGGFDRGVAVLYNTSTGAVTTLDAQVDARMTAGDDVNECYLTPSGRYLQVATNAQAIYIYDTTTAKLSARYVVGTEGMQFSHQAMVSDGTNEYIVSCNPYGTRITLARMQLVPITANGQALSGAADVITDQSSEHTSAAWSGDNTSGWALGYNNAEQLVPWSGAVINSGAKYDVTLNTYTGVYGRSIIGIQDVVTADASGHISASLTKAASLGAMTAGSFYQSSAASTTLTVWMPDGSAPTSTTMFAFAPSLAHEGIFAWKRDGSDLRLIAHTYSASNALDYAYAAAFATWSPDGRVVLFNSTQGRNTTATDLREDMFLLEMPTTTGVADHLALSVAPSGAVSGIALTTQPSGAVQDSGGSTVTSDASTVTATWVGLTGDAVETGGTTATASAGLWSFTTLGLSWSVPSTGYFTFTDGSLTSVSSTVLTLPVGAVSSVSTLPTPIDQWRPKPTREGLRVIVSPSPLIGTGGLVAVASNTVSVHIPVGRVQVSVLSLAIDAMVAAAGSGAITATVNKVTASGVVTPLTAATSLKSDVVTVAGNIALPMLASVFGGPADGARRIDGPSGDYLRVDIIAAGTVTTQPQVRIVAELAVTK